MLKSDQERLRAFVAAYFVQGDHADHDEEILGTLRRIE